MNNSQQAMNPVSKGVCRVPNGKDEGKHRHFQCTSTAHSPPPSVKDSSLHCLRLCTNTDLCFVRARVLTKSSHNEQLGQMIHLSGTWATTMSSRSDPILWQSVHWVLDHFFQYSQAWKCTGESWKRFHSSHKTSNVLKILFTRKKVASTLPQVDAWCAKTEDWQWARGKQNRSQDCSLCLGKSW